MLEGITQALSELVDEAWMTEPDARQVARRIMYENAHEVFDVGGTLAAWS